MDEIHINNDTLNRAPLLAIEQLNAQIASSLILAPHPDDEALGCGGMITYLRQQNVPVWICFMTSGGASHPNSKKYTQDKLMQLREYEALESCKILGVEQSNIIFLREPDSQLNKLSDQKIVEVGVEISHLIVGNDITSIFLPWRRDVHPDHETTYRIGIKAVRQVSREVQIIEYPIWMWHHFRCENWPVQGEMELFRLNVEAVLEIKRASINAHQSQTTGLIDDDANGFMLKEELLRPFLTPFEYFFIDPNQKSNTLNKDYFDRLYASNPDPWNFDGSDYENSKFQKIDSFLNNRQYKNALELGCSIGIQTRLLALHCQNLLAVDISGDAIQKAKDKCRHLHNVQFQALDIITDFPKGFFDFITMCELGYFFNKEDLKIVFQNITDGLSLNGHFLMVHWTSYVREFPLTGKQVHQFFMEFNEKKKQFVKRTVYVHDQYELMLWEKVK
ncbi:MAG: bifunctional PIG-L family deacetylase/class I SAM-dependent methyltransferase [Gelidibacter sp.]